MAAKIESFAGGLSFKLLCNTWLGIYCEFILDVWSEGFTSFIISLIRYTEISVTLLLDYELIEESLIAASVLIRNECFFLVILLNFNLSIHGISISINGIALNYTAKKMPQYFWFQITYSWLSMKCLRWWRRWEMW